LKEEQTPPTFTDQLLTPTNQTIKEIQKYNMPNQGLIIDTQQLLPIDATSNDNTYTEDNVIVVYEEYM